jgi:DNA polymerase-3 subunit delta'
MINKKVVEFHLKSKESFFKFLTNQDSFGSYLFTGLKGTGKKDFVFFLSSKILTNSHKIEKNIHPDFFYLSNENDKILVQDTKDIEKWILYPPFESTRKIIVISKAETMNVEAQNKLLKILEEPPGYVFFFLISSVPSMLLPTVRSRCINIDFQPLPKEFLLEALEGRFNQPEFMDLSIFLLNGSVNNIEFYYQDNLEEMVDFVFSILKKEPTEMDLILKKMDEITKKDFNQSFFVNLLIGIFNYVLKLKHLDNYQKFSIFNRDLIEQTSSISLIELISKMTNLSSNLKWSNFNFRMGIEEILFDFILDEDSWRSKVV